MNPFFISRKENTKQILFMRSKLSYLFSGIWIDVAKRKFI